MRWKQRSHDEYLGDHSVSDSVEVTVNGERHEHGGSDHFPSGFSLGLFKTTEISVHRCREWAGCAYSRSPLLQSRVRIRDRTRVAVKHGKASCHFCPILSFKHPELA